MKILTDVMVVCEILVCSYQHSLEWLTKSGRGLYSVVKTTENRSGYLTPVVLVSHVKVESNYACMLVVAPPTVSANDDEGSLVHSSSERYQGQKRTIFQECHAASFVKFWPKFRQNHIASGTFRTLV